MIAIVDYGVGNLFSLSASLAALGLESEITDSPEGLRAADRYILPGVGAFADAKAKLDSTGLVPILKEEIRGGKPLLGICLGMQMLFERSLEYGNHEGLGFISGTVAPISDDLTDRLKVPHMGWNSLHFRKKSPLFRYLNEGDYVYFVHSYYAKDCLSATVATSDYGNLAITAAVEGAIGNGRVYGTQFHPEKSGPVGLAILKAFSELPNGKESF